MSDIEGPATNTPTGEPAPPPPPSEPGEGGSLLVNLAGVLFSPGVTFRRILARPGWAGALSVYVLAIALSSLVYSLNVDWEAMFRGQFEASLGWKFMSSVLSEDQMDQAEKAALENILAAGRGGMALQTVTQTVIYGTIAVHAMATLFATLFYLMGSMGELKLGRLYLDALFAFLLLLFFTIAGAAARGLLGLDVRGFLPVQAGLNGLFMLSYAWLLFRTVERQPSFKRFFSVYAHAMAVPAVGAILAIIVMLVQSEPLTVAGNEILRSNLGAIFGVEGTGVGATLLSSLEIFRLWELVIVSIGFAAVSRLSLAASAAITFLPWGFVTMATVALAAVFGG